MGACNPYPLLPSPRLRQRGKMNTLETALSAPDALSSFLYDFRNFSLRETDLAKKVDNHGAAFFVAAPGFQVSNLGREHGRK